MIKSPILWGAYLACSWTWCIGMFLPALLLRDHGWIGFLIFAVPNCVGAAAMGWVLRSPESSRAFVEKHQNLVWWFSAITLGFHVFWILWVFSFIRGAAVLPEEYLFGAGAVVVAFAFVSGRIVRAGRAPHLSLLLWVVSFGLLVAMLVTGVGSGQTEALVAAAPTSPWVWALAPLACFGFLLCPYLDATFHLARQNLDKTAKSRLAFSLGFLVLFASMIVLTTRYSGVLMGALHNDGTTPIVRPWIGAWLIVHLMTQWVFTVRVHLHAMQRVRRIGIPSMQKLGGVLLIAGALGFLAPTLPELFGMQAGELTYRSFLWFYGLVFPAALVVALRHAPFAWALGTIAISTPMFFLGFIQGDLVWLVPGVALALIGSLAAPRQKELGGAPERA